MLLVGTGWWPADVRLAIRLRDAGCIVSLLCPRGHPAEKTQLHRILPYRAFRRGVALARAISETEPDLIVPTDDRALRDVQSLGRRGPPEMRAAIERAHGRPEVFDILMSRARSMDAARLAGLPVAETTAALSAAAVSAWSGEGKLVLKSDGSCGGAGVRVLDARDDPAEAMRSLGRRGSLRALKRWAFNRDLFPVADAWDYRRPALVAQRYVGGRSGDVAMFCLHGEMLGAAVAMQEQCAYPTGPSTIVRLVDRPELVDGARRLARSLGLSGFFGLDFIVDDATDEARIIEINPRATPLCGAAPGLHAPAAAAAAALGAAGVHDTGGEPSLIAYFPAAWHVDPTDRRLEASARDVMLDDPALLAELMLTPRWERGLLASLGAPIFNRVTGQRRLRGIADFGSAAK